MDNWSGPEENVTKNDRKKVIRWIAKVQLQSKDGPSIAGTSMSIEEELISRLADG